ncbi:hypothetical protein ACET3Z_009663 [Daucus carota]
MRSMECTGILAEKFCILLNYNDTLSNELNPPVAFVERCGFALPMQIQYVLSNGKKFAGSYDSQLSRFTGFSLMFEILGEANMVGEILDDFMGLSEVWENFQCINVYSGSCRWRLLARKRDDNNCCRIVDGWQKMRDCLGLEIGDICVFQCPIRSFDQFRIRVLKFDA